MPEQPKYDVCVRGDLAIIVGDSPARDQLAFYDLAEAERVHAELGRAIETVRRHRADLDVAKRQIADVVSTTR